MGESSKYLTSTETPCINETTKYKKVFKIFIKTDKSVLREYFEPNMANVIFKNVNGVHTAYFIILEYYLFSYK